MAGRFKSGDGSSVSDAHVGELFHASEVMKQNAYATLFPNNELPFGGSGWRHGFSDGTLWNNIHTTPGQAFGTQVNGGANFIDGVAHLNQPWLNDQSVSGTIVTANRVSSADSVAGVIEEVELLLRFAIDQSVATGYEITYSVDPNAANGQYIQINRWNGPVNGFTLLASAVWSTSGVTVNNGQAVSASIVGTVITVKVGSTTVLTYDTTADTPKYASGAPGIGHFYFNSNSVGTYAASDFGLSAFAAQAA